jgi:hypothetical protein
MERTGAAYSCSGEAQSMRDAPAPTKLQRAGAQQTDHLNNAASKTLNRSIPSVKLT